MSPTDLQELLLATGPVPVRKDGAAPAPVEKLHGIWGGPDDDYLMAITHDDAPTVTIYKRDGTSTSVSKAALGYDESNPAADIPPTASRVQPRHPTTGQFQPHLPDPILDPANWLRQPHERRQDLEPQRIFTVSDGKPRGQLDMSNFSFFS